MVYSYALLILYPLPTMLVNVFRLRADGRRLPERYAYNQPVGPGDLQSHQIRHGTTTYKVPVVATGGHDVANEPALTPQGSGKPNQATTED
jgi:hypothetical protein